MRPWHRLLLGLLFVLAGINHFVHREFYEVMVPPYVPMSPGAAVWWSGVCEILGGVGMLVPRVKRLAAWGLIALLIAVFPANLHMAIYPELFGVSAAAAYARLPVQGLLIYWAWMYTHKA